MNDFKSQLNGLLTTLKNLPNNEQQAALDLLKSSLACQEKDDRGQDDQKNAAQRGLSPKDGVLSDLSNSTEHDGSHPSKEMHSNLLELIKAPKLPHHLQENTKDESANRIPELPEISQSDAHDGDFSAKLAPLQHALPIAEIEPTPNCSIYTQTDECIQKSQGIETTNQLSEHHATQPAPSFHYDHALYGLDLKTTCAKENLPLEELTVSDAEAVKDAVELSESQYALSTESGERQLRYSHDNQAPVMIPDAHLHHKAVHSSFPPPIMPAGQEVVHSTQQHCTKMTRDKYKAQHHLSYTDEYPSDKHDEAIDPGGFQDPQALASNLISGREAEELAIVASEELERSYQESLDGFHLKSGLDVEKGTFSMVPIAEKMKYMKPVEGLDVDVPSNLCLEDTSDKVLSLSKVHPSLPCSLDNLIEECSKMSDKDYEGSIMTEKKPIDLSNFNSTDCVHKSRDSPRMNENAFYGNVDTVGSDSIEAKKNDDIPSEASFEMEKVKVTSKRRKKSENKSLHERSVHQKSKSPKSSGHNLQSKNTAVHNFGKSSNDFATPEHSTNILEGNPGNLEHSQKLIEEDPVALSEVDNTNTPTVCGTVESDCDNLNTKLSDDAISFSLCPVSCRNCKKELTDVSLLSVHQRQCEGQLTCSYCQTKFSTKVTYFKHMHGHKMNSCSECPKNFCSHQKLKAHMKAEHKIDLTSKTYSCSYCTRSFLKRSSLHYHYKIHATGTQVVCQKCGKFCSNKVAYNEHMKEHVNASNFHCNICTESFTRRQQYDDHLKHHQKNKCEFCGQPFTNKKDLLRHCRIEHKAVPQNVTPNPQYKCDECDRVFNRPCLLQQHQHSHTGVKLTCQVCQKKFSDKRSLRKHMNAIHHKNYLYMQNDHSYIVQNGFPCEACDIKLPSKNMLLTHLKVCHKAGVTWSCPYCDYKTKRHYALKTHVDLHAGKRNFMCELCGRSFQALATLKDHHNFVHSDERNYKCKTCDKSFKNQSTLSRHNRTHSEARPYECKCGYSYKRYSHLKRHMSSAHKITLKSRTLKKFKRPDELETGKNKSSVAQEAPTQTLDFTDADEYELVSVSNSSLSSAIPKMLTDMQEADSSVSKGSANILLANQDSSIMLMGENSGSEQSHLITVGDSQIIQLIPSTFQIPQDGSFQTVSFVPTADFHTFSLYAAAPFTSVSHSGEEEDETFINLSSSLESTSVVTQLSSSPLDISHGDAIRSQLSLEEGDLVTTTTITDKQGKPEIKQGMSLQPIINHAEIPTSSDLHTFDYSDGNHTLLPSILPHHSISNVHSSNSHLSQDLLPQNLMCPDFALPVDGDR